MTIHENPSVYSFIVAASFALLFLYPAHTTIADPAMRRRYHLVQVATLFGALFGAKVALLMGDRAWPMRPLASYWDIVYSGRSITGGLLGGLCAAEIAKPLLRYTLPPNDTFAAKLPFSIALGRVGCLLGGCCRGLPHDAWFAVRYDDGIARWPVQAFEIVFQLGAGLLLVALVRRRLLPGRLFSLYLVLYGVFRFGTEFLRETPKPFGELSVYQLLSVVLVAVGAALTLARGRALPAGAQAASS